MVVAPTLFSEPKARKESGSQQLHQVRLNGARGFSKNDRSR